MAIYHMTVKVMSRGGGKSATAGAAYRSGSAVKAAAYRSGQALGRDADGVVYDFTRKHDVLHAEIMTPDGELPDWCYDRTRLWNMVESVEKRKDAQLAREVECSLPRELTLEQQKELVNTFVKSQFTSRGMIADIAIHCHKAIDGKPHPHVHIMLTMRKVDSNGFAAKKERSWNSKEILQHWRKEWAQHVNVALEKNGHDVRIDHRTLKEQGLDRKPAINDGVRVQHMRARGIDVANAGDLAREKRMQVMQNMAREAVKQTQIQHQQQQNPVHRRFSIPQSVSRNGNFSHEWQFKPISMEAYAWQMMGKEADISQNNHHYQMQQLPQIEQHHLYGYEREYNNNSDMDI